MSRGLVLAAALWASLLAAPAGAATPAPLTATRVVVGDHAAYIGVVIDFTGATLKENQVMLTGFTSTTATVSVSHPSTGALPAPRRAFGVDLRMVRRPGRLQIELGFAKASIKYVMFVAGAHSHLTIELWKSAPPSRQAEVRTGRGGCLSLESWRVEPGVVSVTGAEHDVYENTFEVLVRGANGAVLGKQVAVHGIGHWSTQVRYRAPRPQAGTLEAISFGGRGEGMACLSQVRVRLPAHDLARDSSPVWRALPRSPIPGRLDASTVWTGSEMIIWGGVTRTARGLAEPRSDGAAYNPATGKWRRIPNAPPGVLGGGGSAAAWTGRAMVVWTGNSPAGPAGGAVYDPRSDTWRRLPRGPLGVREGYASVWTGSELIIFGGHTGATAVPTAAAVDPATATWRRLGALDAIGGLATVTGAVWNGREAIVSGALYRGAGPSRPRPILFAFNPRTDAVHRIDLSRAPVSQQQRLQLEAAGWTGSDVVIWTGASSASSAVVRYDPTTRRWRKPRAVPCRATGQIAWIGDRLAVACASRELQIYAPRSDTWRTITPGPSPFNARSSSETAWTGRDLIVWSGVAAKPYNPTPADGASLALSG